LRIMFTDEAHLTRGGGLEPRKGRISACDSFFAEPRHAQIVFGGFAGTSD
jgi:hypothetical protein